MAYSVSIAPLAASAVIGATTNFTATTSGATAEGTETFVWTVNGVKQSSVTAAMNYVAAGPAGSKTVKVVATVTPAEGDPETAEAETTLTVKNKTMPAITLTLSPTSVSKEIGQSQVVTADVTDVSSEDYTPVTVTKTGDVTITKRVAPEPDGELPYVHPLPFRGTAYIWCGWWVMDEIQRMTVEGKDWKLDDPDSDYYLHRYTLAKMLDDYPEVDVQESRNGYIVHRTALEAGIIYP
ncbi:highly immunogenic outer capsid protein [Klebsiella phage KP17]|nr:highly immunogenic outer capsid protein [Klebsiella phage KP17]